MLSALAAGSRGEYLSASQREPTATLSCTNSGRTSTMCGNFVAAFPNVLRVALNGKRCSDEKVDTVVHSARDHAAILLDDILQLTLPYARGR